MDEKQPLLTVKNSEASAQTDGCTTPFDAESGDFFPGSATAKAAPFQTAFERLQLIDLLSHGVALVDTAHRVIWANGFFKNWIGTSAPEGSDFYTLLNHPEIEGPDFCPLHTIRLTQRPTSTRIKIGNQYLELDVSPNIDPESSALLGALVELRDVTELARVDETLRRLQNVGRLLADLSNSELSSMSVEERRSLLAEKIETSMREILHYDAFEFRLLDSGTGRLLPFLAYGIPDSAIERELFASSSGNGITGYVANTRQSVLCEDTVNEANYLSGADDARCSITVPVLWYDTVIGTCNVESRTSGAFSDRDKYFLEIFTRDVAAALHTLDLLWHEKECGAQSIAEKIFNSASFPLDRIIQNCSVLLDGGNTPSSDDAESIHKILEDARVIKDQVAILRKRENSDRPLLAGRRILIVDKNESFVADAHRIFEEYGCSVESAPNALIALKMLHVTNYDVVLCEIRPDGGMSGYQLMLRLFDMNPESTVVPLLLTTAYGYDMGHVIVKANGRGLLGVLYKPFKPNDFFFSKIELVITTCGARDVDGNLIAPAPLTQGGDLNRSRPKFVSEPTAPVPGQPHSGFCNRQGADRFRAWADRIPKIAPEPPLSSGDDSPPHPEIDAT